MKTKQLIITILMITFVTMITTKVEATENDEQVEQTQNIENIEKTSLRNETEVLSLWENLNNDFKRLNQDYQKKIV